MLTQRDIDLHAKGLISIDRLEALRHALREDAVNARTYSKTEGMDEREAASHRGRAVAFQKAVTMVDKLIGGKPLKRPWWARFRKEKRTT